MTGFTELALSGAEGIKQNEYKPEILLILSKSPAEGGFMSPGLERIGYERRSYCIAGSHRKSWLA